MESLTEIKQLFGTHLQHLTQREDQIEGSANFSNFDCTDMAAVDATRSAS